MAGGEDNPATPFESALDRLYAAPPAEFVSLRKALKAELDALGDKAAGRALGELKKPSRPDWALNQVARQRPELVARFGAERARAAALQTGASDASALRDALDGYRRSQAALVQAAAELLERDGGSVSAADRRRLGQTLEAAAADPAVRELLTRGRLGQLAAPTDAVAALAAAAAEGIDGLPAVDREAEHARAAERAAEERSRKLESARRELAALERTAGEAQETATRARERLERAQSEATAAASALAAATEKLEAARAELDRLERDTQR